ncbi:hypothetical protein [Maliponia aquimaris]|nr:hypothetical protein [Maliponia aquimaris]
MTLIPIARVLSDLMTGALSALPAEVFYVDTAPHGTDTTCLLAAIITCQAIYGVLVHPLPPLHLPDDHGDQDARCFVVDPEITSLDRCISARCPTPWPERSRPIS